jgi:hypothetical protein
MPPANSIIIHKNPEALVINIDPIGDGIQPTASILNYSGELIEVLDVGVGKNIFMLESYHSKNYSIRVTNGKNIVTQRI